MQLSGSRLPGKDITHLQITSFANVRVGCTTACWPPPATACETSDTMLADAGSSFVLSKTRMRLNLLRLTSANLSLMMQRMRSHRMRFKAA
ncbi:hypothetical protein P3T16_006347 [Paraburkholderia sp. GAS42]